MPKLALATFATLALAFGISAAHARDREVPVSRSIYTQEGFQPALPAQEFADWQKRFQADWDAMFEEAQHARKEEMLERASGYFSHSIESSKKGLSLKSYLVNAVYSGTQYVPDKGTLAKRMMLYPEARPVGYGGIYEEAGYSVEIWYIVLHDLKKMSAKDFSSNPAYSIFKPLELPKFGEGKRGSWPILLFIRNDKKQLMLYGHSKEMHEITDAVQWRKASS